MASEVGMDTDAVRNIAARMDTEASRLSNAIAAIDAAVGGAEQGWRGVDAQNFRGAWQHQHRPALLRAHEAVAGLAISARNNASDQDQTSAQSGAAVGRRYSPLSVVSSPVDYATMLHRIDGVASPFSSVLSTLGSTKALPILGVLGTAVGTIGYIAQGYTIGQEAAQGRYLDATLDGSLTGMDIAGDVAKSTGGPIGYAGGVALKTWAEVGREAREVDWSAQGLREMSKVSLAEWGGAFGDSLKQLPMKLVSIFSL